MRSEELHALTAGQWFSRFHTKGCAGHTVKYVHTADALRQQHCSTRCAHCGNGTPRACNGRCHTSGGAHGKAAASNRSGIS